MMNTGIISMIEDRSVLGIIPARGGSKGLPDKNILALSGTPLINWTISTALSSRYLDRLILSTDSPGIAEVARAAGCDVPFMRPAHLASDEATTVDTVIHALQELNDFDICVVLQPTSPLRQTCDIDAAIEFMQKTGKESCVSVTKSDKSPHWMFHRTPDGGLSPVMPRKGLATRRQDLDEVFVLNGAVYVFTTEFIRESNKLFDEDSAAYVMPKERSVDIDDRIDFLIAETLLNASRQA